MAAGRSDEDRDADSLGSTEMDVIVDERSSFHAVALESPAATEFGCSCRAISPAQPSCSAFADCDEIDSGVHAERTRKMISHGSSTTAQLVDVLGSQDA